MLWLKVEHFNTTKLKGHTFADFIQVRESCPACTTFRLLDQNKIQMHKALIANFSHCPKLQGCRTKNTNRGTQCIRGIQCFLIQPPSEARWFTFWDRRSAEAPIGRVCSRVFLQQVAFYVGIFGRNSEGREFWPSRTE